jgi:CHAT domain-containing protein
MMAIIQPEIPDGDPLPFTEEELHCIEKRVPSNSLIKLGVEGNPATVQNVLYHLPSSNIVHFACHGQRDANYPLETSLILHGGTELKIKDFMKQLTPNASLAFLSACDTAVGADQLADEAIHLAASLLFAGFRGVVATTW